MHPIFQRYQAAIHKDPKANAPDSFASFSRFLCDSPLSRDEIPYPDAPVGKAARQAWLEDRGLPSTWGSYHQVYEVSQERGNLAFMALTNGRTQVDDKVVAFGVLDIIPTGVSSVYFCYDPASPLSADVKWGQVGPQLRSKLPPLALMRPRLPQISALREIALVQDMRAAGLDDFKYEYLGASPCS